MSSNAQRSMVDPFKLSKMLLNTPIIFNGEQYRNVVIQFYPQTEQEPIDILKALRKYFTDMLIRGNKKTIMIHRAVIWGHKNMLFLDYQNENPELNDKLNMYGWPLVAVKGIRYVKLTKPADARQRPPQEEQPVDSEQVEQPEAEPGEVMDAGEMERDDDDEKPPA